MVVESVFEFEYRSYRRKTILAVSNMKTLSIAVHVLDIGVLGPIPVIMENGIPDFDVDGLGTILAVLWIGFGFGNGVQVGVVAIWGSETTKSL